MQKIIDFFKKSIFRRLMFSNLAILLIGLIVVGVFLAFFSRNYIIDAQKEDLLRKARKVNASLQNFQMMNQDAIHWLTFFDQSFDTKIWVFDLNGKVIATSAQDEVTRGQSVEQTIVSMIRVGEGIVQEQKQKNSPNTLSAYVPWGKSNQIYGGIVLHSSLDVVNNTISSIRETILWVVLTGILIVSIIVSYLAWTISRPIQKIERVAAEISLGNYEQRIKSTSSDEIGDLASTINNLATKLALIESERKKQENIRIDFLANVSHELRTPLTAMQGFLEALQDGLIDDQGKQKYYNIIYNETLHMNHLVDDIMDLVHLENNEIVLQKTSVELPGLFKKMKIIFEQEAKEKQISLIIDVPQPMAPIHVDVERMEQILKNIIKNALKFTNQGSITLQAVEFPDEILIQVVDTGIGISPSDQDRVWERFFKVDRGRPKKNKGTGLGLAIVKELVELHGGSIYLSSSIGEGTTISIRLPKL